MRFLDMWNELKSSCPKVDVPLGKKLVNRAWRDIQDERMWSFLRSELTLQSPNAIGTGTATVTQGSPTVTLDGAAAAVVDTIPLQDLIQRTFRAGGGHIYNIVNYVSPDLTLEYGYNDPDAAGVVYMIYQPYYLAPADFLSWISVIDPYAPMPSFKVDATKDQLDRWDPQRGALGQPCVLAAYRYEANLAGSTPPILDRHRYEMWPAPLVFRQYRALYQKQSSEFMLATDMQPRIIPDTLIMSKARFRGYEWCEANKSKHAELKGVNWINLMGVAKKEYDDVLADTLRKDEELFPINWPKPYMIQGPVLGDTYWQNHAPLWGGGYWGG